MRIYKKTVTIELRKMVKVHFSFWREKYATYEKGIFYEWK